MHGDRPPTSDGMWPTGTGPQRGAGARSSRMKVSICIPTRDREDPLERLLRSLQELEFGELPEPSVELVVVDNSPSGSARGVCERWGAGGRWPLRYDIEPVPGVTPARNRAVRNVAPDTDFIAMIDDDEIPERGWLENLLLTQQEFAADVVTGPVFPAFEEMDASLRWVEKGRFFAPPRHPTGAVLEKGFTGNILVRASLLRSLPAPFDDRFALKGAEDTHLFMRLRQLGTRIVWSDEAIARESVPRSRMNLKWILARNFWGWSSQALLEREVRGSPTVVVARVSKGLALAALGLVQLPPSLVLGRHRLYRALVHLTRGVGTLSGVLGFQSHWPR